MTHDTRRPAQPSGSSQNETKLFFDVAYKAYTRLAEVADDCPDEETRKRIRDAIAELGLLIGRIEPRDRPR